MSDVAHDLPLVQSAANDESAGDESGPMDDVESAAASAATRYRLSDILKLHDQPTSLADRSDSAERFTADEIGTSDESSDDAAEEHDEDGDSAGIEMRLEPTGPEARLAQGDRDSLRAPSDLPESSDVSPRPFWLSAAALPHFQTEEASDHANVDADANHDDTVGDDESDDAEGSKPDDRH